MPKPLGMTPTFQTIMPSQWQDNLWDAIQEAQAANVTPDQFLKEVRNSWKDGLKRDAEHADRIFKKGTVHG